MLPDIQEAIYIQVVPLGLMIIVIAVPVGLKYRRCIVMF